MDFSNAIKIKEQFLTESIATLYMLFWTALIAGIIGLFLGIILILTREGGLMANKSFYNFLDKIVNVGRSIPFIIMLAIISPFTKALIGTTIGNKAAIVPLVIGAAPFYARQVEAAMATVNSGVIEAARSMGLGPIEIIRKVWLPESTTALIRASTLTLISLLGLTAMAGAVGAGGLGKLAVSVGYHRFQDDVIVVATVLILVIVFIIQIIGNLLERRSTH